jgi:integral membrane protein (TIGR01906 family)
MKVLARLAAACYIVALPVLLITSNIRFLVSDVSYYKHGFREFDADQATGVSMPQLDAAAQQIVNYFHNSDDQLRVLVTMNGNEQSLFNQRETEHMHDVKSLMQLVFHLNTLSLVVVIGYIALVVLWARERSLRALAWQSLGGIALGLVVVGVVGGFALVGFDAAWTRFHEIAFRNNLWELNPATDHLIQMFPEPFWREATTIVGALTLGEAALVVIVAAAYLVFARQAKAGTNIRLGRETPQAREPESARPTR